MFAVFGVWYQLLLMFLVECFGFELSFLLFAVLLVFALLYLMLLIFGVLSWNKKPDKAGSGLGQVSPFRSLGSRGSF